MKCVAKRWKKKKNEASTFALFLIPFIPLLTIDLANAPLGCDSN